MVSAKQKSVDTVKLVPTFKLVRILSGKELRTQMDIVFPHKTSEVTLIEKLLNTYRTHLDDFSYDE